MPPVNQRKGIFFEFGVEKAVFSDLEATDKASAIRTMVRVILETRGLLRDEIESAANSMLMREEIGSTGIGGGVAAPHTRHPCAKELCVGWFVARRPFDFNALDGEPVWFLNCMINPPNQPGQHLRMLETVSRHFMDDRLVSSARIGVGALKDMLYESYKGELG